MNLRAGIDILHVPSRYYGIRLAVCGFIRYIPIWENMVLALCFVYITRRMQHELVKQSTLSHDP